MKNGMMINQNNNNIIEIKVEKIGTIFIDELSFKHLNYLHHYLNIASCKTDIS